MYPDTYASQVILADGSRLEKNGVINIGEVSSPLPTPTEEDSGKFVRVDSSGAYVLEAIANAEEASF